MLRFLLLLFISHFPFPYSLFIIHVFVFIPTVKKKKILSAESCQVRRGQETSRGYLIDSHLENKVPLLKRQNRPLTLVARSPLGLMGAEQKDLQASALLYKCYSAGGRGGCRPCYHTFMSGPLRAGFTAQTQTHNKNLPSKLVLV